jgi:AAA domain
MVLVIGPARVGKTTLIHLLEERLLAYAQAQMERDPHFIPLASITAPEPGSGRFDWTDFYKPVLRQLGNPFVDSPTHHIPARQMREAMEAAYLERKPLAIIVDEAHHLARARSGHGLYAHLDHLKNFENTTGVSHILVGTYEMRPFRKVNPQLACRSIDVHFPRYDITEEKDCLVFKSILWALQRQLPVEEEPLLVEKHWEFLYARSIGCIGLLKLHLNRALHRALKEGARTVTLDHLRQTAMSDVRVKLVLRNALESEVEFVEAKDADEQLLALLRKPLSRSSSPAEQKQDEQGKSRRSSTPGKRSPGRGMTGSQTSREEVREQEDEERAVG